MTKRVELRAMDEAAEFYRSKGYEVERKKVNKKEHNGFDLLASRDNQQKRIEVKGCSRQWKIPDLYSTEFDENKKLVADELCSVYLTDDQKPRICIIPRDEILPDDVLPRSGFRLSGRLKKKEFLEKFLQSADD